MRTTATSVKRSVKVAQTPVLTESHCSRAGEQPVIPGRRQLAVSGAKAADDPDVFVARRTVSFRSLHFGFDSRCGGFLYSAFAETFRAFRGKDFTARLRWLFDPLKPRAIAGGANNLSRNFKRFFHRDQSLKQNKN
jgi:hypothetical protein